MVSWNPNCCSRSVDQYPVHTTTRSAVMVSGPTTLQLLPDLASDVTSRCSRIRPPRNRAALAGAATPPVEVTLPSLGVYVGPRIPSVPSHGLRTDGILGATYTPKDGKVTSTEGVAAPAK